VLRLDSAAEMCVRRREQRQRDPRNQARREATMDLP